MSGADPGARLEALGFLVEMLLAERLGALPHDRADRMADELRRLIEGRPPVPARPVPAPAPPPLSAAGRDEARALLARAEARARADAVGRRDPGDRGP